MSRYKLTIEYLGKDYCGWQRQPNGLSIQEVLEVALSKLTNNVVTVVGSGRTDSGVHALGQVAHCDMETSIPCNKIPFAVNGLLSDGIRVISCEQVNDDFNARYSAKRKTYLFKLYISLHSSPIRAHTHLHILTPLNITDMKEAANYIVGEHNFKCFLASGSLVKNTIRTIYSLDIFEYNDEVHFEVTGNGFLYNMVRIIVGTLIEVGCGKLKASDVAKIIESGDRNNAGKTVSPKGLYLKSVEYQ